MALLQNAFGGAWVPAGGATYAPLDSPALTGQPTINGGLILTVDIGYDGGSPFDVYTTGQLIDGGSPSDFYATAQVIDGGAPTTLASPSSATYALLDGSNRLAINGVEITPAQVGAEVAGALVTATARALVFAVALGG